ncbi:tape measure protein [Leptospira bandrabouensis]|uniref:tape measure protein n=1 Tax=Leptospira bandrabouensis TaxID=2484903 RepID=UPI00142D3162|nr:tape measure protein [Leptospira bandrabouensis]
MEGKTDKNKKSIGALTQSLTALGGVLGASAIVGGIKGIIDEGSKFETLRTSFNVMMGDVKKGEKVLQDLKNYSDITPFTPDQVMRAGKTLLAFNIDAKKLMPTLEMLGDVSAGTGKDFSELARIFGQISSAGRLQGEDLNQLIDGGFNPLTIIAEKTGKSMVQLKKEMEQGKISINDVEEAFKIATSEGGKFYEMTKKQSETAAGMFSTLQGEIASIKVNMSEGLLEVFKPLVGVLIEAAKGINNFAKESPNTFRAMVFLTTGTAALVAVLIGSAGLKSAIGLVIPVIQKLGITLNASLGTIGLVAAGISGLILLYAQLSDSVNKAMNTIKTMSDEAAKKNGAVSKSTKEQLVKWKEILENSMDGDEINRIVSERNAISAIQNMKDLNAEMKGLLTQQVGSVRGGGIKALEALGVMIDSLTVKTKELKNGVSGKTGLKDTVLTLEEFIAAYTKMDSISNRPIEFTIDYSDIEDAKKAIDELSKKGVQSEMNFVADKNSSSVVTRVKFTAPDGSNLNDSTIRNIATNGKNYAGPIDVKIEPKIKNIDTGMFEGLKQTLMDSFPDLKKFLENEVVGKTIQGVLATASKGIEIVSAHMSAAAQLAGAKLQTMTNQLSFWTALGTKQLEDGLRSKQEAWDAEIKGLQAQKEELLRIEEEYRRKRDEQQSEEIQRIKQRIQEEYNEKAAALQAETMANIAHQEENLSNSQIAELNKELLSEEHLAHLLDLKQQYADKEAAEIEAINARMSEEDKLKAKEKIAQETSLADQIAAVEKRKAEEQKATETRKAELARDSARLQWMMGFNAFQLQKQASIMQAKIQTAMMVIDIMRAAFSMVPFTLPILGFLPMAYNAGTMAVAAASAQQYPPPPATAFARGGMAEGGIPNKDSIPAMLMPGELIVPNKNFEEVVGAVRTSRESRMASNYTFQFEAMHFYGIVNAEAVADEIEPILVKRMRSAVEAMI